MQTRRDPNRRLGIVLTGGGARGAYQAGVLRGVADALPPGAPIPFRIVTGVSAGAINAVALACDAGDFTRGVDRLWSLWSELSVEQVFESHAASVAEIAARWARDLALGGLFGESTSTHLLDTTPLRTLLGGLLDFERLAANVRSGALHGVAVTATSYASGAAVSFFDAHPDGEEWARTSRIGRRASLGLGHVLASSAIPLFFPPERLGESYWGDGCIRLTAPLSPAIHLGAEKVLAIGIRHVRSPESTRLLSAKTTPRISLVDIAGVLLDAVFLDSLEADLERVQRINRTVSLLPEPALEAHADRLRVVPVEPVLPSKDLGALAAAEFDRLPCTLRYMLRGIGASNEKGWDLLSYLAFDRAYTRRLLDLGRADAQANADVIRALLGVTGARRA